MPLFFFNVRTRRGLVEDLEGSELPDLESARQEAILDARALMSEAIFEGRDISRITTIEIRDDEGRNLAFVPFTDAILQDDDSAIPGCAITSAAR